MSKGPAWALEPAPDSRDKSAAMAQHTLFGKAASRVLLPPSQRNMTPIPSKEAKHGLPHVTGTPKFFPRLPPRGPASWVVWHLPPTIYFLSLERPEGGTSQGVA